MTTTKMLGWHFVGEALRGGAAIPEDGETLTHDGPIEPCRSGLHFSEDVIDALKYAPGYTLCRVECSGDMEAHGDPIDKWVCRERTIIQRIDARPLLRAWARWCALQVTHLWDAPDIVREYLTTGDKSKKAAARAAARAAAGDAAWAAARAAAWAAAGDAAWDAAWAAQRKQLNAMAEEALAGKTEWAFKVPERSES